MNKKFKVLALAMSMAFVAPSVAMASDANLNSKIEKMNEEVAKLEKEYDEVNAIYKSMLSQSKGYTTKSGKKVTNAEALQENLFKVSIELDKYVTNVVPSVEQAMLGVYLMNGAKGNGYTIRQNNADDLYKYLKGYFVKADGVDKAKYDELLRKYVDAIYDFVNLSDLEGATQSFSKQVIEKKADLDLAILKRRALFKLRNKEKIGDLEKAVKNAENTIAACKKLMEIAPNKVAGVKDKLDKLVADQEKLIKQAEKLISQYK